MQSLIIAHARNRPECLKDYLPGSEYWSFEEMSRDGSLERLEALAPDFMVIFDAVLMKSRYAVNANRIRTYLEMRKQAARSCGGAQTTIYGFPVSALCISPEEAIRQGLLPKEGQSIVVPEPLDRRIPIFAKLTLGIRNSLMETS